MKQLEDEDAQVKEESVDGERGTEKQVHQDLGSVVDGEFKTWWAGKSMTVPVKIKGELFRPDIERGRREYEDEKKHLVPPTDYENLPERDFREAAGHMMGYCISKMAGKEDETFLLHYTNCFLTVERKQVLTMLCHFNCLTYCLHNVQVDQELWRRYQHRDQDDPMGCGPSSSSSSTGGGNVKKEPTVKEEEMDDNDNGQAMGKEREVSEMQRELQEGLRQLKERLERLRAQAPTPIPCGFSTMPTGSMASPPYNNLSVSSDPPDGYLESASEVLNHVTIGKLFDRALEPAASELLLQAPDGSARGATYGNLVFVPDLVTRDCPWERGSPRGSFVMGTRSQWFDTPWRNYFTSRGLCEETHRLACSNWDHSTTFACGTSNQSFFEGGQQSPSAREELVRPGYRELPPGVDGLRGVGER